MKKSMIIACCLVLLVGCKENRQAGEVVKTIKADTVRIYGLAGSIQFPGKVTAPSDINLAFRVSGPIGNVYARVELVKRGVTCPNRSARLRTAAGCNRSGV